MKASVKNFVLILVGSTFFGGAGFAQPAPEDLDVINVEDLYKKEERPVFEPAATPSVSPGDAPPVDAAIGTPPVETATDVITEEQRQEEIKVKELKDLNQLVPFSEISVIQKKFMPKTERFQFYLGLGLTTNTPWFTNYGAKANLSYNFTESFGLELNTLFLTSSQRQVTQELLDNNEVSADQFIYTKGYYGLDLVWSPIYGKIAFNNQKIINYEMYISLGGGISDTKSKEKQVSTAHVGVGQIFSLTKSMAFRWDYGMNIFQATPLVGSLQKNSYNDLVLTAGISFFFPEADYR